MLKPPLLILLLLFAVAAQADPAPPPNGFYISCGATEAETVNNIRWLPDQGFVAGGNASTVDVPGITPFLSTLRHFPDSSARKNCYLFPVAKGSRYLVRTTYYYGAFDGGKEPPVFDQIIDGTKWSTVDTSANYARGLTSYYEIIVGTTGKTMSVCVARNEKTKGDPFISALEVESLEDSMYNSTDFGKLMLATVARHRFGHPDGILSYPDDPYNRYWEPFNDTNPIVECRSNISSTDFWNLPPAGVMQKALTTSRGKQLIVQWPAFQLPNASYYVSLYFQDNRTPSPYSWRVFDVTINGNKFYSGINVTTSGVMVYGAQWPLFGQTEITLTPGASSPVGPIINAGEILQVVRRGGRTATRDIIVMEDLARSFKNRPLDWAGDPCMPRQYSWTGVECSEGDLVRVVSLKLSNFRLSGTLPESIGKLTAATTIWLDGNQLSGKIPDMSGMKELVSLRLQNNQLTGQITPSLGELDKLQEVNLEGNKLEGTIPSDLKKKLGANLLINGNQIH